MTQSKKEYTSLDAKLDALERQKSYFPTSQYRASQEERGRVIDATSYFPTKEYRESRENKGLNRFFGGYFATEKYEERRKKAQELAKERRNQRYELAGKVYEKAVVPAVKGTYSLGKDLVKGTYSVVKSALKGIWSGTKTVASASRDVAEGVSDAVADAKRYEDLNDRAKYTGTDLKGRYFALVKNKENYRDLEKLADKLSVHEKRPVSVEEAYIWNELRKASYSSSSAPSVVAPSASPASTPAGGASSSASSASSSTARTSTRSSPPPTPGAGGTRGSATSRSSASSSASSASSSATYSNPASAPSSNPTGASKTYSNPGIILDGDFKEVEPDTNTRSSSSDDLEGMVTDNEDLITTPKESTNTRLINYALESFYMYKEFEKIGGKIKEKMWENIRSIYLNGLKKQYEEEKQKGKDAQENFQIIVDPIINDPIINHSISIYDNFPERQNQQTTQEERQGLYRDLISVLNQRKDYLEIQPPQIPDTPTIEDFTEMPNQQPTQDDSTQTDYSNLSNEEITKIIMDALGED